MALRAARAALAGACVAAMAALHAVAAPASAVGPAPTASMAGEAHEAPQPRSPALLSPPPSARLAASVLGLERPRLALVVAQGRLGRERPLAAAHDSAAAVAQALRQSGFVVIVRHDPSQAEWRRVLAELRERLGEQGHGLVYVQAPGLRVDGRGLLLPSDAPAAADAGTAAVLADWSRQGLPLQELVQTLAGPLGSQRLLIVEAAWSGVPLPGGTGTPAGTAAAPPVDPAPALPAGLERARPGLDAPELPPGMVLLLGAAPGAAGPLPASAPSALARGLVQALADRRASGAQVLRDAQARARAAGGDPWLAGRSDDDEPLAAAHLIDLVPRTPQELAAEAARQAAGSAARAAVAGSPGGNAAMASGSALSISGEMSVADVLQQAGAGRAAGTAPEVLRPVALAQSRDPASNPPSTSAGSPAPATPPTSATIAGEGVQAALAATGTAAAVVAGAAVATAGAGAATAWVGSAAGTAAVAAAGEAGRAVALSAGPLARATEGAAGAVPSGSRAAAATPAIAASLAHTPAASPAPPAAALRRNPHGFAEGDTFVWQRLDTWSDTTESVYTVVIEQFGPGGEWVTPGGQTRLDALGRPLSWRHGDGAVSTYEPHLALWWADPRRGQTRRVTWRETYQRADGRRGHVDWAGIAEVLRARRVRTPAGEFEALQIKTDGRFIHRPEGGQSDSGSFTRVVWYAPALGHPVAIDGSEVDVAGKLLRRDRLELLDARRAAPSRR